VVLPYRIGQGTYVALSGLLCEARHMNQPALAAIVLGTGVVIGVVAGTFLGDSLPTLKVAEVPASAPPIADDDDEDSLLAANANLVSSLQECNRRLASAGQKKVEQPSAPATATASSRSRSEGRREPASIDWERYAKQGAVPYNLPCIRDTPFTPSQRQLDRLGLAPQDAAILRDAYAKSNERVLGQLKPLCAAVLGNEQLADRVGSSACMSAIIDGARKENPDKMRDALTRVAEVNGGKRPAPRANQPLEAVEALMLAFSNESKAFEADLAAKLGPEDAKRIASSRSLCSERGVVRATPDGSQP
jgi:hypothetical protein